MKTRPAFPHIKGMSATASLASTTRIEWGRPFGATFLPMDTAWLSAFACHPSPTVVRIESHSSSASASIRYYQQASALDHKYASSRWNLARIFKSLRDREAAERVFIELAGVSPDDFRVFGELGFLGELLGAPPELIVHRFEESLRLNPSQPQIIFALADYYAEQRAPDSAPEEDEPAVSDAGGSEHAVLAAYQRRPCRKEDCVCPLRCAYARLRYDGGYPGVTVARCRGRGIYVPRASPIRHAFPD